MNDAISCVSSHWITTHNTARQPAAIQPTCHGAVKLLVLCRAKHSLDVGGGRGLGPALGAVQQRVEALLVGNHGGQGGAAQGHGGEEQTREPGDNETMLQ